MYTFSSWSDGGTQQHTILVPSTAQSYVATYDVSQNPLPPGLVAGYRLGEGSGTTTADISGNNYTGTLVSGPTWTTGHYGNALAFSGSAYVDLGNPAALQLTGEHDPHRLDQDVLVSRRRRRDRRQARSGGRDGLVAPSEPLGGPRSS